MQFHTDSRDAAEFGAHAPARWRARAAWRLWRWRDAYLHWKNVRGLGELAILARASMLMLVLVPVLAGLWPAIQSAVQRYAAARWHDGLATRAVRAMVGGYDMPTVKGGPFLSHTMPWAFGALFFAALFVVLGRVLYQMHVPDLIRSRSGYEFGLDEKEDFRKHGSVEEERRLQESIDAIAEAGSDQALRWFRHPNLVRRLNRTVWVPRTVQMFRAPTIKAIDTRMFTHGFDEGWVFKEDEEAELNLDECESHDGSKAGEGTWVGVSQPIMAESSRKQIVMEAGADARYNLAGRQNIGWARTALWCYVLAIIAVVLVVWAQSVDVLIGMGLDIFAYLLVQLLVWGPWIIFTAIFVWVCMDLFRASRGLPRERPHWMPEDRWNNLHELDAELAREWVKDP
ncbi:MAG TPA: hypothetical protein VK176_15300 [Phycisphaerales bacterium]|nr:hypothetical protein [Phycisphaerales bacterium]